MLSNQEIFIPPKTSDIIYTPCAQGGDKWNITWVNELLEVTVNNCFKVSDKNGAEWIVKRYKSKDKSGLKAWKALSASNKKSSPPAP